MISINKQGNAIVIEFTDNDKYLFNGTIEVAPNELMIVIDESNMATFKRSNNGDTLFSQLINKIQIGGINVTKDTILDEFAKIGFTTGSGGAVNSVNGQTGDVVITASNVGAYSKNEVDNLLNGKQNVFQVDAPMAFNGEHLSINLTNYATKDDIAGKADSSTVEAISNEVTTNSTNITNLTNKVNEDSERIATLNTEIAGKQAKLIAGQNIELSAPDESGNVTISATGEVSVDWSEITGKPTNFSDWNATEGEKVIANKPDLSEYATKQDLNTKADISAVPTNTQFNNLAGEVANKADKTSVYTKAEADEKFATNVELNHVKSELANKADTSSLNDYALKSEITGLATKEELSTKADSANVYTKAEIDNMIGDIGTRLDQINGEVI